MSIWTTNVKESDEPKEGDTWVLRVSDQIRVVVRRRPDLAFWTDVECSGFYPELGLLNYTLNRAYDDASTLEEVQDVIEGIMECILHPTLKTILTQKGEIK